MRKIIYIIPILLLSIICINNVYGAITNYSTVDDFYSYIESIEGMNYNRKISNTAHNSLKNSELFKSTIVNYNYYVIFGSDVVFFNSIPTIPYFSVSTSTVNPNVIYLSLKFEKTNVKYAMFSFNLETGSPTSSLTENYVGATAYTLRYGPGIGYTTDFFTKDSFYDLFDSNFELVYSDTGEAVVQKKPNVEVIYEYSNNYDSCNITLNSNYDDTIIYYEFYSYLEENYTEEERTEIYKEGNTKNYFKRYKTTINCTKNDTLYYGLYDLNGNELIRDSIKINKIINIPNFSCNFIHGNGEVKFMPFLFENTVQYYDIYINYSSDHNVSLMLEENNSVISTNNQDEHGSFLESGTFYKFKRISAYNTNVDIIFEIRSKDTGEIIFTRGFNVLIPAIGASSVISSSTNNSNDAFIDYGGESNSFGNDYQNQISNDLNNDFSLDNSLNSAKNFFTSSIGFFNLIITFLSMFPAWLYVPINIFLTMVVIVTIIHLIRG